ncbi:MAG: YabP/YqfC family sporulation protein [Oscillospiraceae bacterium]|nr:YabP/YqfC family sporulation protein [Oscillospiraceae bacterium]
MAENGGKLAHKLILEERGRLNLTGAREVIRFDESLVELGTDQGVVVIQGNGLRLKCLSVEDGGVVIQGQIDLIAYDAPRGRRGLFR